MRATVLLNRGGGAVAADDQVLAGIEAALAGAGLSCDIEQVNGPDIADRARAAAGRGDPLLIVGGGDG
ncbi:MAG TPA: hypothetical protein VFS45_05590, partial [Sphingomicrobium sp.]|nr:hypothetical protein [Sphingomicrobium sp.]